MKNTKGWLLAGVLLPVVLGSGCVLIPARHGPTVLLAPPLPPIITLGAEPYYAQEGYHYHYRDDGWYYARSRSGPWSSLPRDRYPKEIRYQDGRKAHDKGRDKGHGRPPEHH